MDGKFSALETQVFGALVPGKKGNDGDNFDDSKDLGFSNEVTRTARRRLLNRDGSFNVRREGYSLLRSRSVYHSLLTVSWPRFFGLVAAVYVGLNLFFGSLFFLCGPFALKGLSSRPAERFLDCFFFSVQTFATIGYGRLTPDGLLPNAVVTLEALVGLLCVALATGVLFARFSRPTAKLIFSKFAVIAPYRGVTAFEFRVVNERKNQLTHLEARVMMSRLEKVGMSAHRKFYDLSLERRQVMFFPLHWTITHKIEKDSPLYNVSRGDLVNSDAEFLVMISGTDDTFSQTVHTWSSYKHDEIIWGGKFEDILEELQDGTIRIDLNRIHNFQREELPVMARK